MGAIARGVGRLLWLAVILCAAPACEGARELAIEGQALGTTYHVKALAPPERDGPPLTQQELARQARDILERIETLMSTYRSDSELSRFNQFAETAPFPMAPETLEVFQLALEVSAATGGAFDITVGPLVNAWGFGPEKVSPGGPSEAQLLELKERVGYQKLRIDAAAGAVEKLRPGIYCDLGAIAKGYAVDEVAEAVERLGVGDYMVEVGGEVRAKGRNVRGVPWQIAIEKPITTGRAIERIVPLSGKAMATSGDYRNYYEKDGVRLSHTIDPRTGRPIAHKLASVSVIHDSCAVADAYATALMVLGPGDGFEAAIERNLAALLIVRVDDGFVERPTPAFDALFPRP